MGYLCRFSDLQLRRDAERDVGEGCSALQQTLEDAVREGRGSRALRRPRISHSGQE